MWLYRGEQRLDLRWAAEIKLPIVINSPVVNLSIGIEAKKAPATWRSGGSIAQLVFLPTGKTIIKSQNIRFGTAQAMVLDPIYPCYLAYLPPPWLKTRTFISIRDLDYVPVSD